jgi:hypothetical protein
LIEELFEYCGIGKRLQTAVECQSAAPDGYRAPIWIR